MNIIAIGLEIEEFEITKKIVVLAASQLGFGIGTALPTGPTPPLDIVRSTMAPLRARCNTIRY